MWHFHIATHFHCVHPVAWHWHMPSSSHTSSWVCTVAAVHSLCQLVPPGWSDPVPYYTFHHKGDTPWAYYPPHATCACWNTGHNGPCGDSFSIWASSSWTSPYIALDKQPLWPFIFGASSAMAFVYNSQSTSGCPLSPARHVTSFFKPVGVASSPYCRLESIWDELILQQLVS